MLDLDSTVRQLQTDCKGEFTVDSQNQATTRKEEAITNNVGHESSLLSRRGFVGTAMMAGGISALGTQPATAQERKKVSTVPLDWKQVWYTNCPMVSANNIDQELGWCKTDFKKIGVDYDYFRRSVENDWYPHYIHNLDNLIRFGGLYPPIHVQADIRRTRLLGAAWVYEGGCMLVRAGDPIFRVKDLKSKKIGLSKSLNTIKNDWWRIQEHMGIMNMLMMNDMTMNDVEIIEFPYPDDWYDDPKMMKPMINPTDLWATRDHKHDWRSARWRRRC